MPLLALWEANPKAIAEMTIEQLVATAGDGRLRDKSECSRELHDYLLQAPGTAPSVPRAKTKGQLY